MRRGCGSQEGAITGSHLKGCLPHFLPLLFLKHDKYSRDFFGSIITLLLLLFFFKFLSSSSLPAKEVFWNLRLGIGEGILSYGYKVFTFHDLGINVPEWIFPTSESFSLWAPKFPPYCKGDPCCSEIWFLKPLRIPRLWKKGVYICLDVSTITILWCQLFPTNIPTY